MSTRERILKAIADYKLDHGGNSPSYREIAELAGCSKGSVQFQMAKLVAAGLVLRDPGDHRCLTLAQSSAGSSWTPLALALGPRLPGSRFHVAFLHPAQHLGIFLPSATHTHPHRKQLQIRRPNTVW